MQLAGTKSISNAHVYFESTVLQAFYIEFGNLTIYTVMVGDHASCDTKSDTRDVEAVCVHQRSASKSGCEKIRYCANDFLFISYVPTVAISCSLHIRPLRSSI